MKHVVTVVTAMTALASAASAAAGILPFSGSIERINPGPQPGLRCAPALTIVNGNGPGRSASGTSNLGGFSYEGTQCIVPPPTGTFDGRWTMDFGGGLTLTGTNTSVLTPSSIMGIFDIAVSYVITGGTGRFRDATGTLSETGTLDRRDLSRTVAAGEFEGFIDTPSPATLALVALGWAGLGLAGRRRVAAVR